MYIYTRIHAFIYVYISACMRRKVRANRNYSLGHSQEQSEEKPTPTKNKRSGTKRLSTLERTAQEGEALLKVRFS